MYKNKIRVRNQVIADIITKRYVEAKKNSDKVNLKMIINRAECEYHLTLGTIKESRIKKRCQRTQKSGILPGQHKSPLHEIEDTIVEFALQRSLVKRPFNQEELIDFTNSLINDTPLQTRLVAWQTRTKARGEIRGTVGKKWYRNFKKRHPILADKYVVKYGVEKLTAFRWLPEPAPESYAAYHFTLIFHNPTRRRSRP